jgi:hypothetical protein
MKIQKIVCFVLIIVAVFAVNSFSQEDVYKDYTDVGTIEGQRIPIEEIFLNRDKYHREIIIIEGKLSEIKFKNLVGGKKFTLFLVEDENGNNINVYARGTVEGLEEGSNLRVHGRYSKSKKFLFNKYKNIMKARKIQMNSL